jgi:hypothetical protein
MSKFIFNAKLLQVQTSVDQNTGLPKIRLVFASQRYDKGLEQIVPVSQNVTLIDGHHHLVPIFEALKGKEIFLPIEMSTMMNGMQIFYKTVHDGRPLNLVDNKNEKSIP